MGDVKAWQKASRVITFGDKQIAIGVQGPPGKEEIAVQLTDLTLAGNPKPLVQASLTRNELENEPPAEIAQRSIEPAQVAPVGATSEAPVPSGEQSEDPQGST